jgi:hypothetical protein
MEVVGMKVGEEVDNSHEVLLNGGPTNFEE